MRGAAQRPAGPAAHSTRAVGFCQGQGRFGFRACPHGPRGQQGQVLVTSHTSSQQSPRSLQVLRGAALQSPRHPLCAALPASNRNVTQAGQRLWTTAVVLKRHQQMALPPRSDRFVRVGVSGPGSRPHPRGLGWTAREEAIHRSMGGGAPPAGGDGTPHPRASPLVSPNGSNSRGNCNHDSAPLAQVRPRLATAQTAALQWDGPPRCGSPAAVSTRGRLPIRRPRPW